MDKQLFNALFKQLVEDGAAGGIADGVAHALFGFVEAMAQVQIAPTVGCGHGLIHLQVHLSVMFYVAGIFAY